MRTVFDTEQKSSKFLLEIVTLVSSANNVGSDIEFFFNSFIVQRLFTLVQK